MKFYQWLAKKLPKQLVYYTAIRLIAEVTTGQYKTTDVSELTVMESLQRYGKLHRL